MVYHSFDCRSAPVEVNLSHLQGSGGADEYHLTLRPRDYGSIESQLEWVFNAYKEALDAAGLDVGSAVLRRFFCSDLSNQAAALRAHPFSNPGADDPCAVSWVCQPPLSPAKVALWAYHVNDAGRGLDKERDGAVLAVRRGAVSHYWMAGITCPSADTAYGQTRGVFDRYEALLKTRGMTLADNAIRTWIFVRNIDANYHQLAAARREYLAERGLTPETHFVASTGVGGACVDPGVKVAMDAYAISGLRPGQVRFLSALDHLSPTHIYGVTFERGASVAYGDRRHVMISGTASIDSDGKIVHPGDAFRQLDRTLENIEVLLKQAGAGFDDVCVFIVYVRDLADQAEAAQRMRERFGQAPMAVALAPVCRPGWLIEVECMAIVPSSDPELPAF